MFTDARHLAISNREIWIPGWNTNQATDRYRVFNLPKEAEMVMFTVIGSGGGGGRPNFTGAGNVNGASAGSSGGYSHLIVPANRIPPVLYLSAGLGGRGGTANNTAGEAGIASAVSVLPTNNDEDRLIFANGGSGGIAAGTGPSTGGAIATIANGDLASLGVYQFSAGVQGGQSSNTGGFSSSAIVSVFVTGGGGGGGSGGGQGGGITSGSAMYPTIEGALTGNNQGADGFYLLRPMLFFGGAGGGGVNGAGGANHGGNGSFGCGGGGGGNSVTGASGNGGNGGPGLIIIKWW